MTDYSFEAMTTVWCSTERATLTGGYSENLVGLKCTPRAPVDSETMQRAQLNTPHITWEHHLQNNPDIVQGDKLVIGTDKYPVLYTEPYTWLPTGDKRIRLIVEDLRN